MVMNIHELAAWMIKEIPGSLNDEETEETATRWRGVLRTQPQDEVSFHKNLAKKSHGCFQK